MTTEIDQLIEQLLDPSQQHPSAEDLCLMSGLARHHFGRLREIWHEVPADRRRAVVRLMAKLADERVELDFERVLRLGLEDDEPETRSSAVGGLWECEDPTLVAPLVRLLLEDGSSAVRAAAATALGRFVLLSELGEIESAVGMLAERSLLRVIYALDEDLEVRRRSVESIAYSSEAGVADLLESAYGDEDRMMRASSIFAMGRSADSRWRPVVRAELENADSDIRFEAARASGDLEDTESIPVLLDLLDDEDGEDWADEDEYWE